MLIVKQDVMVPLVLIRRKAYLAMRYLGEYCRMGGRKEGRRGRKWKE